MSVENHLIWKRMFQSWPAALPRAGVLVTEFDQVIFSDFRFNEEMLYAIRSNPDALGARSLMIPFGDIKAVKFVKVIDDETADKAGLRKSGASGAARKAPLPTAPPAMPVAPAAPANA